MITAAHIFGIIAIVAGFWAGAIISRLNSEVAIAAVVAWTAFIIMHLLLVEVIL